MDDLDFSVQGPATPPPAPKPVPKPAVAEPPPYDPQLAARFFRQAGEEERYKAGEVVFVEGEKPEGLFSKRSRMYLLLEGQIGLTLKGKPLHLILPGETFGELAIISDAARTATATALKNSRVLALDIKRFVATLPKEPEFALLLLGVLAGQMRNSIDRLLADPSRTLVPRTGGQGLTPAQMSELSAALGAPVPARARSGEIIVRAGGVGVYMFVMVSGRIAIHVNDRLVEHVGAGETFGEMAMLGNAARMASATADEDCSWLQVSRAGFLDIVRRQPTIGIALLRSMSERIQHLNGQLGS